MRIASDYDLTFMVLVHLIVKDLRPGDIEEIVTPLDLELKARCIAF